MTMDIASKRLKCTNCNIVICEVLAFIQNKIDVMTESSLVQICESAFSSDEIEVAKSLLFESVSKTVKTRQQQGKTLRNIEDIICLFKETDPEQVPIFVARNLEKLPPVTLDHVYVTPLLKRIDLLEKTIHDLPQHYVSKSELKDHFNVMGRYKENSLLIQEQNINVTKRGGELNNTTDRGPMALSTLCNNNVSFTDEINEPTECLSLLHKSVNEPKHSCHSSPIIEVEADGKEQRPVPAKCDHSAAVCESGTAAAGARTYIDDNKVEPVLATVNKTAVECASISRKKVKKADPPKRPKSAYMIWLDTARDQIRAENPGMKPTELVIRGRDIWKSMKDKTVWEEKSAKAKEQYTKDLEAYERLERQHQREWQEE